MPEARPCPHCGALIPEEPVTPGEADLSEDLELPPVPLLAPGSHDDEPLTPTSSSRIEPADPDPILGPYGSSSSSALLENRSRSRSGDGFPNLNLGSRIVAGPDREPSGVESSEGSIEDEDGDEVSEPRGKSWGPLLLASYASAVTLGLAWILIRDHDRDKASPPGSPPTLNATVEPARQSGLSRKVEPPEPILGEHFATMGQPLRVGDLEITPIDVKRQSVTLERSATYARADRKSGGKGALVLRLKLKNLSKDSVFAPLDQAYLRERGKEIVDTFIESATDERIYPYPLAIESEWSIVDQKFDELKPGESRTVLIVSSPDAPPDSSGPFTWRVRLRTGINRTDVIGLRWPEP